MYQLLRRLTPRQLTREELPLLVCSLSIAEVFYEFHSFLLEAGAFLVTWCALGALHAAFKPLITRAWEKAYVSR